MRQNDVGICKNRPPIHFHFVGISASGIGLFYTKGIKDSPIESRLEIK